MNTPGIIETRTLSCFCTSWILDGYQELAAMLNMFQIGRSFHLYQKQSYLRKKAI